MIIPEWKRILEGKEKFQDAEVESIANTIMKKMEESTDSLEIIELNNDLERIMGRGEWMTRSIQKLDRRRKEEPLFPDELDRLNEKIPKLQAERDNLIAKYKEKYGL